MYWYTMITTIQMMNMSSYIDFKSVPFKCLTWVLRLPKRVMPEVDTYPNEWCQRLSTCSMHGLVTCSSSMASSRHATYERFHGLGTTASSSRCAGTCSFLSSSFSRGSFSTKSTAVFTKNWCQIIVHFEYTVETLKLTTSIKRPDISEPLLY